MVSSDNYEILFSLPKQKFLLILDFEQYLVIIANINKKIEIGQPCLTPHSISNILDVLKLITAELLIDL